MPWWEQAVDLVLRNDCLCCGRLVGSGPGSGPAGALVGAALCVDCAVELAGAPQRVTPREASVPVFTCGPYGGAHRALVLAAKDHMRGHAVQVMGRVWAGTVEYLAAGGVLAHPGVRPTVVIPAPTRPRSARARGGDIVTAAARVLAEQLPGMHVAPVAWLTDDAPDAVGLNRAQRRRSLAENLRLHRGGVRKLAMAARAGAEVVIVDDVCTTGATIAQLALALAAHGVRVRAALAVCFA